MSRSTLNFCVDLTLLTVFALVLVITAILHFVFPPGMAAEGWTLWGAGYTGWSRMQLACISLMGICVLVHLLLHWTWVCGFIMASASRRGGRRRALNESEKTLYGVASLITVLTLLGALVAAAEFSIRPPPEPTSSITIEGAAP